MGMVLWGGWLDLMISEVFSNLCFCDSITSEHEWPTAADCMEAPVQEWCGLCVRVCVGWQGVHREPSKH